MIRFLLGLLIVFGAVGEMDYNPDSNIMIQMTVAFIGLMLMYFGSRKLK